ncbi:MAG: 1-deoxy-D-xylulose-5-phosphate reductoisomerase [Chloroflexota bacterium]|nr:1-deoxy-D-xylulose-5-phosphate reductoisomerase [Chloroflexota bacterium]
MTIVGIALLGSTGSIGTQTLDVIRAYPDRFRIVALAAGKQVARLEAQVAEFQPDLVVGTSDGPIAGRRTLPTPEGLIQAATHPDVDIVVAATSGHDSIRAIYHAIEAGKTIALANKETIVCAGDIIMPLARKQGVAIRPVDSEHSAVWQSLGGRDVSAISRIILTASGGPFLRFPIEQMRDVTVQDALAHPNWSMGAKLTIDSATMMNKGLEVIEAHHLFDSEFDDIDVVIHPEQIIHSMIELEDYSVIAQLSPPDMRLPIQYALTYPDHIRSPCRQLDFTALRTLTFDQPDLDRFPALRVAREAGRAGQTFPTVLSAADELAVAAFMDGAIRFLDIPDVVERVLDRHEPIPVRDLETIAEVDSWARRTVKDVISEVAKR